MTADQPFWSGMRDLLCRPYRADTRITVKPGSQDFRQNGCNNACQHSTTHLLKQAFFPVMRDVQASQSEDAQCDAGVSVLEMKAETVNAGNSHRDFE
jgi:hypothetical protein